MQIFLIHRFVSRKAAVSLLGSIARKGNLVLHPIILDSFGEEAWKSHALSQMKECEVVAVYDLPACMESKNAAWEISQAQDLNKPVVLLNPNNLEDKELAKLSSLYHYDEEFSSLFQTNGQNTEVLYKMMVESSEQLIQRRQKMNAFFITAIGSLIAIAGALTRFGTLKSPIVSFFLTSVFGVVGLLICNSWRNLIENYGKLNTAKFRVILELEKSLSARIFLAEWTALGKGRRPQKYKSFTTTERTVPLWFAILIFCLWFVSSVWHIWGWV